jgi:serine/threonine protein kinase
MKALNHKHVVRYYDVLDTNTQIYVIMEFISGKDLFELISSRGNISEQEARFYFR